MASPITPQHSRQSSMANDATPRRDSRASIHHSPHTPNRQSFHRSDSISIDVFSSGGPTPMGNGMGLGNLADELADAWNSDEGEDDEPDMNFQDGPQDFGEATRDSGVDVTSSPMPKSEKPSTLNPPVLHRGHRRQQPSDYDGSDYGGDSDLETPGIPPGLLARIDMVESLVRRGTEKNGTEQDRVVERVVDALKDLGGQSGVENNALRLNTVNSALSANLLHQSRLLQSLAYPLFSPLSLPPSEESIDELLPLLISLQEAIPRPMTAAFNSLTQLHGLTSDLVQTLNYLSDTLHMSRQTTTTATRRLKSARELVAEMKKDDDEREEGERWLAQGNWSERLGKRECASVCTDVVGGFEDVCNSWRARLFAQAEGVSA